MSDDRVLLERDRETGIARISLNNPERRNSYDPAMREQLGAYLDDLALDDDIKVVLLRGEGGVFSTGADMGNAYAWYGDKAKPPAEAERRGRRPGPGVRASAAGSRSTARRSTSTTTSSATRRSPSPRSTATPSAAGFELALMADISVVGRDTQGRHAGHPVPRPGARARCTCSSTGSVRSWPAACC